MISFTQGEEMRGRVMLIGIISDIHGKLCDEALRALAGCDHILFAGDAEREALIAELEALAPTTSVRGNCDHFGFASTVPFTASPRLGGVKFFMTHRPEDIGQPADDVQVVVHGHTHVRRWEEIDGVIFANPGSATVPRDGLTPSVLLLEVEDGTVSGHRFVEW